MNQRIIILADVHLGLVGLQPDGRSYGDATPMLERAIERIGPLEPDRIILLGDLVNRGHTHEYEKVKRILSPLDGRLEPMLGNHELQRAGIARFEEAFGVRPVRQTTLGGLPVVILNSGIEGLPDSDWQGRLDGEQLAILKGAVEAYRGRPLLLFIHHPLAGTVGRSDEPMLGLSNSAEVARVLEPHGGPLVVISGHTHLPDIVQRGGTTYLGCPALGFWPHAFMVLEVGPRGIDYEMVRVLDDPAESPDARATDAEYRRQRGGSEPIRRGRIEF